MSWLNALVNWSRTCFSRPKGVSTFDALVKAPGRRCGARCRFVRPGLRPWPEKLPAGAPARVMALCRELQVKALAWHLFNLINPWLSARPDPCPCTYAEH